MTAFLFFCNPCWRAPFFFSPAIRALGFGIGLPSFPQASSLLPSPVELRPSSIESRHYFPILAAVSHPQPGCRQLQSHPAPSTSTSNMTEVSATRLYLGNLPKGGKLCPIALSATRACSSSFAICAALRPGSSSSLPCLPMLPLPSFFPCASRSRIAHRPY